MALPTLESKEEKYKVAVFQHVPEKKIKTIKPNKNKTKNPTAPEKNKSY